MVVYRSGHPKHELHDLFQRVTLDMSWEYDRVRKRAGQNSELSGDQIEESWASIISNWLPPNYEVVTKSAIINERGDISKQMDILVLKPTYPREMRKVKPHLSIGVIAAFECKLTLRLSDIENYFERFSKAKKLYAPRNGSPFKELRSPLICGLLAHSIPQKGQLDEKLQQILLNSSVAASHPRELMDILCIADYRNYSLTETTYAPPSDPTQKNIYLPNYIVKKQACLQGICLQTIQKTCLITVQLQASYTN